LRWYDCFRWEHFIKHNLSNFPADCFPADCFPLFVFFCLLDIDDNIRYFLAFYEFDSTSDPIPKLIKGFASTVLEQGKQMTPTVDLAFHQNNN
jgi:hypothetical protein